MNKRISSTMCNCVGRYCDCSGRIRVKPGEIKRLTKAKLYPFPLYLLDDSYIMEGDRLRIYGYLKENGKKSSKQIKEDLNLSQYAIRFGLPTLIRLGYVKKVNYLTDMNRVDYVVVI